ncbi:integrase domain-containing protein [Pseudoduganella namucuonensis]|uniref:Integrase n=1 Tax=Pseudoduganella namucuonensis TaxID=1035707 RepID=A0A1I7M4C4_9BURK|nr:integrase domain-containing protein [Pseudoduganella namucuonensis]SFV16788.1 Integrase [Pseudoduganella namucuonensis]
MSKNSKNRSRDRDWKARLAEIIGQHNEMHAFRNKIISHGTRTARSQALFRMFGQLRDLGYGVSPNNLGDRHVAALVRFWCGERREGPQGRVQPCSAAYIQQQLSFLRVYAGWIGKPGLVRAAVRYVDDPALVTRHAAAKRDLTWAGNGVDAGALIARVEAIDKYVGVQLRLMIAFGMRRKEAVMFWPHVAEVPSYALPGGYALDARFVSFLRIRRGTKGGRLRYTAVRSDAQRDALERARRIAPQPTDHVGHPGLSLKQALDRFSNVVRTVGMTRDGLGVTAHGLRHEFANDLYFEIAQVRSPVQGGDPALDPKVRLEAYREVAEQLGHHRPRISTAYLGAYGRREGGQSDEA